jgi:hypothetical protein
VRARRQRKAEVISFHSTVKYVAFFDLGLGEARFMEALKAGIEKKGYDVIINVPRYQRHGRSAKNTARIDGGAFHF